MIVSPGATEKRNAAARHLARSDFYAFLVMWLAYQSPALGKVASAWRFKALAHVLRIGARPGGRLLLSLPPFLDASTLVAAVWTAWRLGCDATLSIVCVTNSKAAGRKPAQACRAIMEQGWYKALFPDTKLASVTLDELRTTRGGGRFCASFNSARPTPTLDLLILDDALSMAEARSDAIRARRHAWLTDTIAEASGAGRGVSIVAVSPRTHVDDFAGRLLREGGWDQLELPAITPEARRVATSDTEVHHWAAGVALDPDGHPPEVLDRLRQEIGPAVFDARYQQRPSSARLAQDVKGWPRYEAADVGSGPRPVVWSWVLRVDSQTGLVTATGAYLAGEAVLDGPGRFSIATASERPSVSRHITRAEVLGLGPAAYGPSCRLLSVNEISFPLAELPAQLDAARRRWPADNLVLDVSGAGRSVLEATGSVQAGRLSACEMTPAAARTCLADAIAAGMLVLPVAASWNGAVEDQLGRLHEGGGPLSPVLLAMAQGLHSLRTGEAVVQLSMNIGVPGVVAERDEFDEAS